jgi:hypothetical protein
MIKMVYKGIKFDDWVDDTEEYNSYWSEICEKCYQKHKDVFDNVFGDRMDDGGSGVACCGIDGCTSNKAYIYLDFMKDKVSFISEGE